MSKQKLLDGAEVIDSYRVFPRLFLIACFIWSVHTCYLLINWYIHLPDAARGLEASGFGAVALTAILTFLKLVYTTYSEAGRTWGPTNTSTSSTLVVKEQTTETPAP